MSKISNFHPPAGGLISKVADIPKKPGIYQFLSKTGEILYVGKAKNLNSRVKQYFQNHDTRAQLPFLMAEAVDINYTVVSSELESLFLENTLIKQHAPKYNIDLKDDKNYAFIKIDYSTEIPQIGYARKLEQNSDKLHPTSAQPKAETGVTSDKLGVKHRPLYFGPYSAVYKIRNTLNLIRKIFPYCASEKVGSRPCFYYYMHRCPGVCIGKISIQEYKLTLDKIVKFLQGNSGEVAEELEKEMKNAAKRKKFETAGRLRDQLKALQILQERQNVIFPKKVNWDIVSVAQESGYACINLFKIRDGKMFDKENFVYSDPDLRIIRQLAEGSTDNNGKETMQRFLEQYYLETSSIPQVIYSEIDSEENDLIKQIIKSRFKKNVKIEAPKKGQLKKLVALGKINSEEYLKNWLNAKAGHLDKINNALTELKEVLSLKAVPKRIECYDISNTQGTNAVGSMVVFIDGLPAKNQYRKFKIQYNPPAGGPDDFAMMKEMLTRRLARSSKNQESGNKGDWPLPDLIVIDGGKGQLAVALESLQKFQITNSKLQIPVIGLAKRIEEIFLPNKKEPIILNHDQPGLQMLQRIRDEAHRFGITFHRQLRSKQAVKSALDDISGIGPKTKKLLKTKLGTITQIKNTPLKDLEKLVGTKLAQKIKNNL